MHINKYENWNLNCEAEQAPVNLPTRTQGTFSKRKSKISAVVISLTLLFALVGGIIGGFSTGYLMNRNIKYENFNTNTAETFQYATSIATGTVNSINNIYEANKSAVVGVRNDGSSTNVYGQAAPTSGSGTGFIISDDGYILTNNHVVENAYKLTITLYNEDSYTATVVGTDLYNDVALLKIDATDLTAVKLGDSDTLVVGETILAIGNPLGELTHTVTAGIVSGENREINGGGVPISVFQTDAAINPGNSGGPLFNLYGKVVGIATAKYASATIEGIGFAIPINDAVIIANQLKATGQVNGRPYLGVSVINASNGSENDADLIDGAFVTSVDPNGAAAKAGIQQGDTITSVNGEDIKTSLQLKSALKAFEPGSVITVTVNRDGNNLTLTVTLRENKTSI